MNITECNVSDITSNSTSCHCVYGHCIYGHSLNNRFAVAIATYFIILIGGALTFNILLIQTIVRNKILYSSTNIFIVNLAVCDMITAMTTLPFETEFLLRGYYGLGRFLCGLKETVFMFSLPSAIVNLFLLTLDRFVLIVFPHRHKDIFTKTNIFIIIIASWSYTLIVAFFPLMLNPNAVDVQHGSCYVTFPLSYSIYQVLVNFAIPLASILLMNVMIYRVAKRHTRNNHKNNTASVNFRAAKIIMTLCGVCLFCWLTYIIMVLSNILCSVCHPRWLTWSGNALNYSSIALNPILYGLLNTKIRTVLFNKYCPCSLKSKRDELLFSRT